MALEPIVVVVPHDLQDLLPLFLAQRKADQAALSLALPLRDFARVRKVAHGMAGAGASYGFGCLSELGDAMVIAARASDNADLLRLKDEFDDFMSRLVVKYQ